VLGPFIRNQCGEIAVPYLLSGPAARYYDSIGANDRTEFPNATAAIS